LESRLTQALQEHDQHRADHRAREGADAADVMVMSSALADMAPPTVS